VLKCIIRHNMSNMKTRRQASAANTPSKSSPNGMKQEVQVNGNGSAHPVAIKGDEPQENIFIFIPNIIG
jgi:hypothetical protein